MSFARNGEDLRIDDIAQLFGSQSDATHAFELFDRDGNGDASLQEVELAITELGREREALLLSMADLDNAVG